MHPLLGTKLVLTLGTACLVPTAPPAITRTAQGQKNRHARSRPSSTVIGKVPSYYDSGRLRGVLAPDSGYGGRAGAGLRSAGLPRSDSPAVIGGPFALLLAASTDLGPSRADDTQLTVTLHDANRPEALIGWAGQHGLSVRWRPGDELGDRRGCTEVRRQRTSKSKCTTTRSTRPGVLRITPTAGGAVGTARRGHRSSAGSSATPRITRRGRRSCRSTCRIMD